jgi:ubiquinone/menaquinone biosynthesis C-methylase UbiE
MAHVCPWWGGYFIDNRLRRRIHDPGAILAPHVQPGMTVVDFGCGMGFTAIEMATLVGEEGRVVAIDLQQQMLDILMKRAAKAGVDERIEIQKCEADSIGEIDAVDFALAFYSAHEVPDVRRLLAEIHECLKPEARFLIIEPKGHVRRRRFEEITAIAKDLRFAVVDEPSVRFSHTVLLKK